MWWLNKFYSQILDEKKEGEGGGGGEGKKNEADADLVKKLADQTARNEALEARLAALEGNNKDKDKDLSDKAREQRQKDDASKLNQNQLEAALKFNISAPQWLKDNAALLPKGVQGIFDQAAKENYSNAIEKDGAIKAGIVSEFFAEQANLDLLTPAMKLTLEDFLKLTKNVKQERAQSIYDTVFEPAFEMQKRIRKAEQLSKGGVNASDSEAAYKEKMINLSRKNYLGEK